MPEKNTFIQKNNDHRSLILAGGGIRLAYQAGVLQALKEANIRFDHIDGTSGGIFNTAMLASHIEPEEMMERWRKVNIKHFLSLRPIKNYFKLFGMMGFGDADGIRDKIFPALGIDMGKIKVNDEIQATFNVCNFSNKSIEAIPHKEVTVDHLIAGVSLPILMPALKINGDWYSDAVWIKDANLMEAVQRGAEEIWLVWAIGNAHEYLDGFFNQYVHMIEMSANGGLLEEFAQINRLNERIANGDSPYGQTKPIRLHVIKPEYPLPLDPDLVFDKVNTTTLVNMGYADTVRYLQQKTATGLPFDQAASKMKNPGVTLNFRLHFSAKLQVGGKQKKIAYWPSFTLRELNGMLSLTANSSLLIEGICPQVPTRNNQVSLVKDGKKRSLQISAIAVWNGIEYQISASTKLAYSTDWLLGLEFKRMDIQITEIGKSAEIEGQLTQSIRDRLIFVRSSHVTNGPRNIFKRKWKKWKMLQWFYQ